ncbi:transporter [Sphingomonas sp.]|uniref:transporter n=1 Tax=Sphingomonas sp. TaxID=28214 RepID=UPI002EDA11B8
MRTKSLKSLLLLAIAGAAAPAAAQELRPFCANRPSLGSAPCIIDPGHAMLELGVGDWERQDDAAGRTDTILSGDALLRYGVGVQTEVQIGWTAIGHQRVRDATDAVERQTRVGDVRIGVQQNVRNPDGSGLSLAIQPFVTVPTGRTPIGAGTWGGGMVIPATYELNDVFQLQVTGEVDAAPDEDGAGRHLAYSGIAGLAVALSKSASATLELFAERDRDPDERTTVLQAALSGGYQLSDNFQIDAGATAGLNADSPDVRLFFGFSRRF